jgi:hypothetical protein
MNPLYSTKKQTTLVFLFALGLACFGLSPSMQAVVPAPDGGYPGGNTAEGQAALLSLTTGGFNTAVGFFSLRSNDTGSFNTALGAGTLFSNAGDQNTAAGVAALLSNATGNFNTADGAFALFSNTVGSNNTATGVNTLFSNTHGSSNTAIGGRALFSNIEGHDNTAVGYVALFANVGDPSSGAGNWNSALGSYALSNNTGAANSAVGFNALLSNTTGNGNTAMGASALVSNTTGSNDTAVGIDAFTNNSSGTNNTAVGSSALDENTTGDGNTAVGVAALSHNTTGSNNTVLGGFAGQGVVAANNVICIGANGADVSNTCFIGNIRGVTTINNNAIPVLIDSAGQLGTASSSRRFKREIKPMNKASEAILALKPVTFHYKSDKANIPQFGLIAEEVAEVNPDLVVRDENGEIYTVRYEAVNAMLLNEFLKEHRRVEEQEKTFAELKSGMTALAATVKEQAAQIQKVSAQLEASKPAPQVVNNP